MHYSVIEDISSLSFGGGEVRIIVRDNEITGKEALDRTSLIKMEEYPGYIPKIFEYTLTISGLYVLINKAYKNLCEKVEKEKYENGGMKGFSIEVTYNQEFHYPEYIRMLGSYNGNVDGGLSNSWRLIEFSMLDEIPKE